MRFRIKAGGPAARFTFDRTPKPQPPAPPVLRAADLDNPYGRYYGKARSWEDILKNNDNFDFVLSVLGYALSLAFIAGGMWYILS